MQSGYFIARKKFACLGLKFFFKIDGVALPVLFIAMDI